MPHPVCSQDLLLLVRLEFVKVLTLLGMVHGLETVLKGFKTDFVLFFCLPVSGELGHLET